MRQQLADQIQKIYINEGLDHLHLTVVNNFHDGEGVNRGSFILGMGMTDLVEMTINHAPYFVDENGQAKFSLDISELTELRTGDLKGLM